MKHLLVLAFLVAQLPVPAAKPAKPNIVLIVCDDLGYSDVGFNGAKDIKTPALDSLAKNGTIFTSAYVAHPFCGPSRMGLMSGRYPHSFGAPFNLPNISLGIEEFNKQGIPVGETLISTVLQEAGYTTGAMGKWHMGTERIYHPNERGFDDFYGFLGGGHSYFPEKYVPIYERQLKAGKKLIHEYVAPLEHNGKQVRETEYMTDALSRETVRFVNEATKKEKPFFLYLSYNAPHTPLEAKEEDLKLYAGIVDEKRRIYAAMVHAVDRGVRKLVATLRSAGELEETLIVFLSDNGGKLSAGATNRPLSKGKGSVFEGGIRVPMFFHWPARVSAGQRFHHPVSALDFYPTFAGLAGATIPESKHLDGVDIWPDFLANRSPRSDGMIFALRHRGGVSDVSARQGPWKAIRFGGVKQGWQLFNLEDDVAETMNLAQMHPHRLKKMVTEAEQWSKGHTKPRWFDSLKAQDNWKKSGMPKYEATFKVN